MKIEVIIDREDIRERLEKKQPILFEVPWEHNGMYYPMTNWSDFGHVLGWWAMTAIQLLEEVDERRFMFMDGPYFINARYYRETGLVELSPKGTEVVWKVQMFDLLTKLVEALDQVYEELVEIGISPKDLDYLKKDSAMLKTYLTNASEDVGINGVQ